MKKSWLYISAAMVLCLAVQNVQAAEPLAFQGVMKDLGKHMQTVAGAIAHEDWDQVAQTAALIGDHPKPSLLERTRIFAFVGTRMSKFKEFDTQTHEAAHEMADAASVGDGMQVINQFQQLQAGCLGCHQTFRSEFVTHFYGKK
jgi:cytochrome c556